MNSRWSDFSKGAIDSLPLVIAAAPFGIIFGALASTADISQWVVVCLSALVFAGSAQYVAMGLIVSGVPVVMIILTTFVVNLRHLLYGLSLAPQYQSIPLSQRLKMAFFLTDETYVTVSQQINQREGIAKLPYYWGSALFMYGNWQLCTWLGLWAGGSLSGIDKLGLEFAMVTAFIGMLTPMLKNIGNLISAVIAIVLVWYTREWPYKLGLIASLVTAVLIATVIESFWKNSDGVISDPR